MRYKQVIKKHAFMESHLNSSSDNSPSDTNLDICVLMNRNREVISIIEDKFICDEIALTDPTGAVKQPC